MEVEVTELDDTEALRAAAESRETRKYELEAMVRASRLMREAADILFALPATVANREAVAKLGEACGALAGPRPSSADREAP